jgi:uracil-DNA glycosylase
MKASNYINGGAIATRTELAMNTAVKRFLYRLQSYRAEDVCNPWAERNADDLPDNGPAARRERLAAHLAVDAAQVLIGEAPGYQGCRISGIPFTSERLIMAGLIPRLSGHDARLSRRPRPWSEPSATIVWSTLHELGIAHTTVLWNAFPWHPYRPGNPCSNRAPTRAECQLGLSIVEALLAVVPRARLFAVGRYAERVLREIGREAVVLRHPAQGGAGKFRRTLRAALRAHIRTKAR